MKKDLHLDSDLIVHKVCCSLGYGKEEHELPPFRIFCAAAKQMTKKWCKIVHNTFEIGKVYTHLTSKDRSNFRYQVECDPPYKHNRKDTPDPPYLHELRKWYQNKYRSTVTYGAEADDTIGIECSKNPKGTIRFSEKDLRMIPGWHMEMSSAFNFMPVFVTDPGVLYWTFSNSGKKQLEGWGYKWFAAQMIVGDRADGISGIPKQGDVAAFNALSGALTVEEIDDIVYKLYVKHGIENMYEVNKQLLWILREPRE